MHIIKLRRFEVLIFVIMKVSFEFREKLQNGLFYSGKEKEETSQTKNLVFDAICLERELFEFLQRPRDTLADNINFSNTYSLHCEFFIYFIYHRKRM